MGSTTDEKPWAVLVYMVADHKSGNRVLDQAADRELLAILEAARETDIPEGGTMQGYGVKFFGPGTPMSGQNERSSPVVMQYIDGHTKIAWPSSIKTVDPVLPLPKGHAYAR